jgi:hypothetical protein
VNWEGSSHRRPAGRSAGGPVADFGLVASAFVVEPQPSFFSVMGNRSFQRAYKRSG